MSEDALERFVDARLELVLTRLREYLAGIPFEVIDKRSAVAANSLGDQEPILDGVPEAAQSAPE